MKVNKAETEKLRQLKDQYWDEEAEILTPAECDLMQELNEKQQQEEERNERSN